MGHGLFLASVVTVPLGGLGGTFQANRIFLILLSAVTLDQLLTRKSRSQFEIVTLRFILATMLLGGLSIVWSIDRSTTLASIGVLFVNCIPVLFVCSQTETGKKEMLPRLRGAWVLCSVSLVSIAVFEFVTGIHSSIGFDTREIGGGGAPLIFAAGFQGNWNNFSVTCAISLLGMLIFTPRQHQQAGPNTHRAYLILKQLATASIFVVITLNSSRGVLIFASALLLARFPGNLILRVFIGAAFAAMIVAIVLQTDEGSRVLSVAFGKFLDLDSEVYGDSSRYSITTGALDYLLRSGGFGSGLGASTQALETIWYVGIPNPHNLLAEWALEFSVFGLGLLVWYLAFFWYAAGKIPNYSNRRMVRAALFFLPVLGLVQSHLVGFTYFWQMLATLIAIQTCQSQARILPQHNVRPAMRHVGRPSSHITPLPRRDHYDDDNVGGISKL